MEELETDGLVVRETQTGTADKIITLLTPSYGRLSVSWKGASSLKKKYSASAQPFAYSTFQLRKKGDYYYIEFSKRISGTACVNILSGMSPFAMIDGIDQELNSGMIDGCWRRFEDFMLMMK